jgi:predicted O-methyltransferase YrrM
MIKLALRYLIYKLFAPHRGGFGIHSPFVFHIVSRVLSRKDDENLKQINEWRKGLNQNTTIIETSDTGAGSTIHKSRRRSVRQIAGRSSIQHKYGRILYKLAKEFKPATIIELGTGIGISTAYLAKGCPECRVFSVEGDKEKMNFAAKSLEQLEVKNVTLFNGVFKDLLTGLLADAVHPVLIFIDGDHSYNGTMAYFSEILKSKNPEILVIFDDIRWSKDMERAWYEIKLDPAVVISIDLFFMGIVFFREGITKQDFVVNF